MSSVVLTPAVRANLLALRNTSELMNTTQQRLATGKRVNSALDNPTNFFTAQSLGHRADDLNALLDQIGQAQQVLHTADNGLTALTKLVQSAKSIAEQAKQAPQTATGYTTAAFTGSADVTPPATTSITGVGIASTFNIGGLVIRVGGVPYTVSMPVGGYDIDQLVAIINSVSATWFLPKSSH